MKTQNSTRLLYFYQDSEINFRTNTGPGKRSRKKGPEKALICTYKMFGVFYIWINVDKTRGASDGIIATLPGKRSREKETRSRAKARTQKQKPE